VRDFVLAEILKHRADAVEDVLRADDVNTPHEPELALARTGLLSNPAPTVRTAQG